MIDILERFSGQLLSGAGLTLQITLIASVLACCLSLPLALLRRSPSAVWRWPVRLYVSFFRGTPLLAQLFLIYYGSGQFRVPLTEAGLWWFFRDPYYCALLTFVLNSTAYQVEILRGGLRAVPTVVMIDDHAVDVPPAEHLLVLRNDDRPGMIGTVGTVLGSAAVNIDDMAVGSNEHGAKALMAIATDRRVPAEVAAQLRAVDGIVSVIVVG